MQSLVVTRILTLLLIIIYISLFFFVVSNERWSDGDEVSYLLFASSILKDGDLVITNNYENKDYFTHHSHEESPHSYKDRHGELRPQHGILLPIIIAPAYELSLISKNFLGFESNRAFLFFPRLTLLIIHIFFSIVLINFLRTLGFSKNISILTVILYLIQLPIVIYSQAIYSDLIAGYFIMTGIFGVLLFAKNYKYKWLILTGILFGLSIFLHSKLIILTAFLIFGSFIYLNFNLGENNSFKNRNWFKSKYYRKIIYSILGPWLILLIANVSMKFYWFGAFNFDGLRPQYMAGFSSFIKNPFGSLFGKELGTKLWIISIIATFILIFIGLFIWFKKKKSFFIYLLLLLFIVLIALSYPFTGLLGQWLDIEVGVLWNAPVFAFIFVGLFIWFKKQKSSFLLIAPAILAYMLLKARFGWYPGFCPPGRYLLVCIPSLLPGISWILWSNIKIIWMRWFVGITTFISLVLSSLIPFVGRIGLPYSKGYNIYWRTILKFLRLESLEPIISLNFLNPGIYDYIIGTGIFILLLGLGFYLQRKLSKIEKITQTGD